MLNFPLRNLKVSYLTKQIEMHKLEQLGWTIKALEKENVALKAKLTSSSESRPILEKKPVSVRFLRLIFSMYVHLDWKRREKLKTRKIQDNKV